MPASDVGNREASGDASDPRGARGARPSRTRAIVGVLLGLALTTAVLVALEWLFPARSAYYRAKDFVRIAVVAFATVWGAIWAIVVRRRVVWSDDLPSWSAAALEPPFRALTPSLAKELASIPSFVEQGVPYQPCSLELATGKVIERCVVLDASSYRRLWPGAPPLAPAVRVEHLLRILPSADTLDAKFVARNSDAPTARSAGMRVFRIVFANGNAALVRVDRFLAIPEMPVSRDAAEVIDVTPVPTIDGPVHESPLPTLCIHSKPGPEG